jgi:hypothetical protein
LPPPHNEFFPTRLSSFALTNLLVFVSRQPWLTGFAPASPSFPPVVSLRVVPAFAAQVSALAQVLTAQDVVTQGVPALVYIATPVLQLPNSSVPVSEVLKCAVIPSVGPLGVLTPSGAYALASFIPNELTLD